MPQASQANPAPTPPKTSATQAAGTAPQEKKIKTGELKVFASLTRKSDAADLIERMQKFGFEKSELALLRDALRLQQLGAGKREEGEAIMKESFQKWMPQMSERGPGGKEVVITPGIMGINGAMQGHLLRILPRSADDPMFEARLESALKQQ